MPSKSAKHRKALREIAISNLKKDRNFFVVGLTYGCHYGIITTNGKSLDFQGVSAFVAVYSIPFPKLKYGEKIDEKRRLLH